MSFYHYIYMPKRPLTLGFSNQPVYKEICSQLTTMFRDLLHCIAGRVLFVQNTLQAEQMTLKILLGSASCHHK
jgi:hypothetical protein